MVEPQDELLMTAFHEVMAGIATPVNLATRMDHDLVLRPTPSTASSRWSRPLAGTS